MIPQERYTITLRHEYLDSDGQHHSLEKPIAVSYSVFDNSLVPPPPILINDMMDRLKMSMIEKMETE